jgi:tetratricopeptide (TPR) repeat protein
MNLTLQTATIATSLFAALLIKAGSANPTGSTAESRKAGESWAASLAAEQSGDYREALYHTGAWRQAGGDTYVALLRTAWLHHLQQDHAKAAGFYAQASSQRPSALTPLLGLLNTAQAMNDGAKIQAAAERILRVEPTNYRALMAAASAQFAAADYRRARSTYTRVLSVYPEDNDALSGVAWSAFYLGDKSSAQRGFQQIATISPDYPFVQDGLALCAR